MALSDIIQLIYLLGRKGTKAKNNSEIKPAARIVEEMMAEFEVAKKEVSSLWL